MFRKVVFLLLCTVISASFVPSTKVLADDAYVFDEFNVDIRVNSDYTFEVIEEITVDFNADRHGIYRYLPNFWGEDRIKYHDIVVAGAPFKLEKSYDYIDIRIGDADVLVRGIQKYIITYTIALPPDSNLELDSIYMNVIGFDHPVATLSSEITIKLPNKVDPNYMSVFSGYYFDNGISDKISYGYDRRNRLNITLKQPLEPYEGITVKIDLPQGYFKDVKTPFFLDNFLKTYLPALLITLGLLIWAIFGRDKKIIIPVEIDPPDVSPAEAGYIIDGVIDGDDIAVMIIFWASKGFITIEETNKKGNYNFTKVKDIKGRPNYEKSLFNYIFELEEDQTFINTKTLTARLAAKSSTFKSNLKKKYKKSKKLLSTKNTSLSKFVLMLAYLCFSAIGFFAALSQGISAGVFLAIVFGMFFTIIQSWLKKILTYTRKQRVGRNVLKLSIFLFVSVVLLIILLFIASNNSFITQRDVVIFMFGSMLLTVLSYYTNKLTDFGHEKFERVLGFRHFMLMAEKDWLDTLANDDPEFFYDRLPYALALGVSNVWIKKFANSITVEPSWYIGTSSFNTRTFASQMSSNMLRVGRASSHRSSSGSYRSSSYSSSSSSSFSSGGGFSGGGFSGGGSSSW